MTGKRPSQHRAGTLGGVIEEWKRSPEYRALKPSSKARYGRLLNHFQSMGNLPIVAIKRGHIMRLRDKHADRPGTSAGVVSLFSTIMSFAVDREYIGTNPAARVARPKMGHRERWSAGDLALLFAGGSAPIQRAALLALETGQRRGDLLALRWDQYANGVITLRQEKTGQLVEIPATAKLAAALEMWRNDARAATILHSSRGTAWTGGGFGASWDNDLKRLGLAGRVTFHGLRATFCCIHAENGATPHQIMAMSGHQTLKQVENYTRGVDRRRNASAAINRLDDYRKKPSFFSFLERSKDRAKSAPFLSVTHWNIRECTKHLLSAG